MRKRYWATKIIQDPEGNTGDTTTKAHYLVGKNHIEKQLQGDNSTLGEIVDMVSDNGRLELPFAQRFNNKWCIVMTYLSSGTEALLLSDSECKPLTRGKHRLRLSLIRRRLPLVDRGLLDNIKPHFPELVDEDVDD